METEITTVRQADGGIRLICAQDARHAAIAREIIQRDPAMIDHLSGVDGIRVTVRHITRAQSDHSCNYGDCGWCPRCTGGHCKCEACAN